MAGKTQDPNNAWKKKDGAWNWELIQADFISGRWDSYDQAAAEIKIRPGYLRLRGAQGEWGKAKALVERDSFELMLIGVKKRLGKELERQVIEGLQVADLLRAKGVSELTKQGVVMTPGDAIRAIQASTEILRTLIIRPMMPQAPALPPAPKQQPDDEVQALEGLIVLPAKEEPAAWEAKQNALLDKAIIDAEKKDKAARPKPKGSK